MSEPPSAKPSLLFGGRIARGLAIALLAGVAAVVAFTRWDAGRVHERERFEEVTGVGDERFFALPANAAPGVAIAQADGRVWKLTDTKERERRDVRMVRVARDEGRGLNLYRPRKGGKVDEIFVKIRPSTYLRLVP